jgi:hypothetical protein
MTKQLVLELKLKLDEDFTLEDVQEVIENKTVTLKNAQKNGETVKINRI